MALLEPLHDDDAEMYTKLIQIAIKCGPEGKHFCCSQ